MYDDMVSQAARLFTIQYILLQLCTRTRSRSLVYAWDRRRKRVAQRSQTDAIDKTTATAPTERMRQTGVPATYTAVNWYSLCT